MKTSSPPHKIEPHTGCVANAVKILGNKWTALILLNMADCERRFCEIERSLPGISPRTLSQRLEELVEHRIITKKAFAEVPPRVEYTLTDKGRDFIPVLRQMAAWGTKYTD
ncbi:MAG TPA: helix-turn-helix domain-containing protein [Candidatus Saccharimonadales bacterium]|nr:helix-turn-helix domain-containing protein [Candidatus Saccharimonadales bacterium]